MSGSLSRNFNDVGLNVLLIIACMPSMGALQGISITPRQQMSRNDLRALQAKHAQDARNTLNLFEHPQDQSFRHRQWSGQRHS